jgi:hypothetical protein
MPDRLAKTVGDAHDPRPFLVSPLIRDRPTQALEDLAHRNPVPESAREIERLMEQVLSSAAIAVEAG